MQVNDTYTVRPFCSYWDDTNVTFYSMTLVFSCLLFEKEGYGYLKCLQ